MTKSLAFVLYLVWAVAALIGFYFIVKWAEPQPAKVTPILRTDKCTVYRIEHGTRVHHAADCK